MRIPGGGGYGTGDEGSSIPRRKNIGGGPQGESKEIEAGGFPEWPKGSDCKSDGNAFEGSNPSPSIGKEGK